MSLVFELSVILSYFHNLVVKVLLMKLFLVISLLAC